MKILKYLLYFVGVLVLIAIVLGFVGPKSFDVNRTAIIPGSPEQVWPYVSSLKNMQLWSPWAEKDTAMVVEYTGTDGTVGSMSNWSSSKVGKGSQTIIKLEPTSYAETEVNILGLLGAKFTGYVSVKDTTGGSAVTWGMKGENGFMGRFMGSIMNMDKMMAPDFERGLTKLTELVAAAPKMESTSALKIMPGEYAGGKYLGIHSSMGFDKIPSFYEISYGAIFPALEKAGGKPAGMPAGLYYEWDVEKMTADLAAAVAFTGDIKTPAGMEVINLPAAKSLTIDYMGGYNGIGSAHEAMDAYMKENNLEQLTPVIEEYVTDPASEPDSTKWLTKVVYFVK
ncbi:MAG: SRPBCC family protein [Saprospiraceae bacterium]|nr:SRPBCC family protein [Saprospiraceae bacterium]